LYLIVDEEIRLQHHQTEDAEALFNLVDANRDHLSPWMPWVCTTQSVADQLSFVQRCQTQFVDGKGFNGGIYWRGVLVGCVGQNGQPPFSRMSPLGYWLDAAHTGKGIMTRSVRALITHLFDDVGLNRIEMHCATQNKASRAIPERLGFAVEGVQREAEWVANTPHDLVLYAMLASQWPAPDRSQE
jgi:ribosomal-protein-serine acetyltransferase